MDVADAIKVHFADSNKDLGIWFDLFSVSQHKVEVRPFEWWNSAFLDAIREIGKVLMLVQSFEKFIVCKGRERKLFQHAKHWERFGVCLSFLRASQ